MNILDLIKSRRSIREYKGRIISKSIIRNVIEAGRWAPSAHNLQPWKFVVITNKAIINKIAALFIKKAENFLAGFNIMMRQSAKTVSNSKCLVLVYRDLSIVRKMSKFGESYAKVAETFEIQSASAAIQNMLLYLHSCNLGAAWMGVALLCEDEINALFSTKNRLMAVLTIGYPVVSTELNSIRKKMSEIMDVV